MQISFTLFCLQTVLFYKNNFFLAAIEEKDKNNSVGAGGIGN